MHNLILIAIICILFGIALIHNDRYQLIAMFSFFVIVGILILGPFFYSIYKYGFKGIDSGFYKSLRIKYKSLPKKYAILVVLILLLPVLYFHPTKEVMNCDSHRNCVVEKTHLGIIKTRKEIRLYPSLPLSCQTEGVIDFAGGRHSVGFAPKGLYLEFNGNYSPFIFYVAYSKRQTDDKKQMEKIENACNAYKTAFQKYMDNEGMYTFNIQSMAHPAKTVISVLVLIILVAIFCL